MCLSGHVRDPETRHRTSCWRRCLVSSVVLDCFQRQIRSSSADDWRCPPEPETGQGLPMVSTRQSVRSSSTSRISTCFHAATPRWLPPLTQTEMTAAPSCLPGVGRSANVQQRLPLHPSVRKRVGGEQDAGGYTLSWCTPGTDVDRCRRRQNHSARARPTPSASSSVKWPVSGALRYGARAQRVGHGGRTATRNARSSRPHTHGQKGGRNACGASLNMTFSGQVFLVAFAHGMHTEGKMNG